MVIKLKYELGIGNLKLFERTRGCGVISKLVVLLILIIILPHHVMFHPQ
jgi:hypothetical protein